MIEVETVAGRYGAGANMRVAKRFAGRSEVRWSFQISNHITWARIIELSTDACWVFKPHGLIPRSEVAHTADAA